jgi:hypothetical protein
MPLQPQGALFNNTLVSSNGPGALVAGEAGWIDCSAMAAPLGVWIQGMIATDTCDIRVSNRQSQPDISDAGVLVGASITQDGLYPVVAGGVALAVKWLRVRRTAVAGGGVVSASVYAQRNPAS